MAHVFYSILDRYINLIQEMKSVFKRHLYAWIRIGVMEKVHTEAHTIVKHKFF